MIMVVFLFHRRSHVVVMGGFPLTTVSIMVVGVVIALPHHVFNQVFLSGGYFS
jgi:hypothetical protein